VPNYAIKTLDYDSKDLSIEDLFIIGILLETYLGRTKAGYVNAFYLESIYRMLGFAALPMGNLKMKKQCGN